MRITYKIRERGAVSIFIVIFTALLVTVVTTSFVQIMLRNQQQASNNDLSQSAYDSAMAGVEDAKRALVSLKKCQRLVAPGNACDNLRLALTNNGDQCEILGDNANVNIGVSFNNGEVQVGDPSLNQAYTCVKVAVQTSSYEGALLDQDDTVVIPLLPVGDPNAVTAVRISWYTKADLPQGSAAASIPAGTDLPRFDRWGSGPTSSIRNVPPIMRSQLMQFAKGKDITLQDFSGGAARSRFLYPNVNGTNVILSGSFEDDTRRATPNSVLAGGCKANFNYGGYACSVELALPAMTGADIREAYLQLAALYNQNTVHYKVELLNGVGAANVVSFDNVQPEIDATGRASDLFRRVKARVTVSPSGTPLPFPEAPVTTKDLCKEFFITNSPDDYNGDGNGDSDTCSPS